MVMMAAKLAKYFPTKSSRHFLKVSPSSKAMVLVNSGETTYSTRRSYIRRMNCSEDAKRINSMGKQTI